MKAEISLKFSHIFEHKTSRRVANYGVCETSEVDEPRLGTQLCFNSDREYFLRKVNIEESSCC